MLVFKFLSFLLPKRRKKQVSNGNDNVKVTKPSSFKDTDKQLNQNELKWTPLKPIGFDLLPVEVFNSSHLPASLYNFAKSNAYRLDNAPIEYIAVALIVSLSSLLGCGVRIKPKRNDTGWLEPSNTWGLVVGKPSMMKTPSLKAGMSPIKSLQNCADDDLFSFIVNDATYEAACIKAQENPKGILMFRDELSGWLNNLDKPDRVQERAFYLEGFSVGSYEQIRISRDSLKIKNLTVSVLGGIQPTKLLNMLRARKNGTNDDGLFERFQLMVFPDSGTAIYTDVAPDEKTESAVNDIFSLLANIGDPEEPLILSFNEEAQLIWNKWAVEFKYQEKNSSAEDQTVMGKYPALCGKLALIFHLVNEAELHDNASVFAPSLKITPNALLTAISWSKLLLSHNRRIQHFGNYYSHSDKAELFLKRLALVENEPFTLRNIYRGAMNGLKTAAEAKKGADELIEKGYLRSFTTKGTNNKPLHWFYRHPDLLIKIKCKNK